MGNLGMLTINLHESGTPSSRRQSKEGHLRKQAQIGCLSDLEYREPSSGKLSATALPHVLLAQIQIEHQGHD